MKRKFSLYIRHIHRKDKADDLRTAIRLGMADIMDFHYAIVQRYHSHRVLEVGTSRLDLKKRCSYFWRHS